MCLFLQNTPTMVALGERKESDIFFFYLETHLFIFTKEIFVAPLIQFILLEVADMGQT